MGNKTSKIPTHEWLDLCEVYKTTGMIAPSLLVFWAKSSLEHVEARLVEALYHFRDELVQRLRVLFDERSWVDPTNSKKCKNPVAENSSWVPQKLTYLRLAGWRFYQLSR